MKLHTLEFPEADAEIAAWLEQHLLGPQLGAVIAELTAIHQPTGDEPPLREVLGPHAGRVALEGLQSLPSPVLRQLLTRPRLLWDLQQWVLVEGGPYWEAALRASPAWPAYVQATPPNLGVPNTAPPASSPSVKVSVASRSSNAALRGSNLRTFAIAAASLAAAVLLFLGGMTIGTGSTVAWGWQRPGVRSGDVAADVYLDRLAGAAHEWFDARPADATAVALRLGELRQGCTALIFAQHAPLSVADRDWLLTKCRAWGKELDAQLARLEDGADPLAIRADVDGIIHNVEAALRTRAEELRAQRA